MKLNEDIDTPGMCSQYLARFSDIKIMKNPKAIGMAIINSIVIVGGFNFFVSVFLIYVISFTFCNTKNYNEFFKISFHLTS